MRFVTKLGLVLLALFLSAPIANAQGKFSKIPTAAEMLDNTPQGKEFWIAIPPNEYQGYGGARALELYVTSAEDTEVTLEVPGLGLSVTKELKAMKITTFSTETLEMNWGMEIRESEVVTNLGLKITADQPLSVYMLSARTYTSEGYLAIPTNVWGKRYRHMSYYDYYEGNPTTARGNGMVVIAKEDNTQVRIFLRGQGSGPTVRGRTIGDVITVTLNEGETYMVRGNGIDRSFDLTGSEVIASKPVGFLSFHMRTIIPTTTVGSVSRDYLVEMPWPTQTWGKEYVTVEYDRENRGDYFRILAHEDETEWEVTWYDKLTGVQIGHREGLLDAGEWYEYNETTPNPGGGVESIKGTSVWKSNRPVMVMQYSYSAGWDGARDFDPFMILVVPREQYVQGTVFQTPSNAAFNNNYFNFIAVGDPDDPAQELLKSIKIDGAYFHQQKPEFLARRIPNTDLYWGTINLGPGVHRIESETRLGGYIYGFSTFESYGWPAAGALRKLDQLDTVNPNPTWEGECGIWEYTVTETTFGEDDDNPRQEDTGPYAIEIMDTDDDGNPLSYNFEIVDMTDFDPAEYQAEVRFTLQVIDFNQPAYCEIYILDRAGNDTIITQSYTPDIPLMEPNPADFGQVRVGTTADMDVRLINNRGVEIELKEAPKILDDSTVVEGVGTGVEVSFFEVVDVITSAGASIGYPYTMKVDEELTMRLRYLPEEETEDVDTDFDLGYVILKTCNERYLGEVIGQGVLPHMVVNDFDAKVVSVDEIACAGQNGLDPIIIENTGTMDLVITGINGYNAPFSWDGTAPVLPVTLAPGETIEMRNVCYAPKEGDNPFSFDLVEFETNIDPETDRDLSDTVSDWKGASTIADLFVDAPAFPDTRVGDFARDGAGNPMVQLVRIWNEGTESVMLTNYTWSEDPTEHFVNRGSVDGRTLPNISLEANGVRPHEVRFEFHPTAEGAIETTILPEFGGGEIAAGNPTMTGFGILPKIEAQGYVWTEEPNVGIEATEIGYITITNPSETADLLVWDIEWGNGDNSFTFVDFDPDGADHSFTVPMGETVTFDVRFNPITAGDNVRNVIIVNDAHEGAQDRLSATRTPAELRGVGIQEGLAAEGWDFGSMVACDNGQGEILVSNTGTVAFEIESITLVQEDQWEAFTLQNDPAGTVVAAGASVPFAVNFTPLAALGPDATYTAKAVVRTADGLETQIQLDAVTYSVPVEFMVAPQDPELVLIPGVNTFVQLGITGDVEEAAIGEAIVSLTFDRVQLSYEGINFDDVLVNNGWTVTDTESTDGDVGILTLKFVHPTASLPRDFLGSIEFKVLLHGRGADLPIALEMGTDEVFDRNFCVNPTTVGTLLELGPFCLDNVRPIDENTGQFNLGDPTPSAVVAPSFDLDFGIAYDIPASIKVFTMDGRFVSTIIDENMEQGSYTATVDATKLPNGMYIIRMEAGSFEETTRVVIKR